MPPAQLSQVVDASLLACLPASQSAHALAPAPDDLPALQSMHDAALVFDHVPASHLVHALLPASE